MYVCICVCSYTYCCCSVTKSCLTLCDPMDCSILGIPAFTIFWSLLKLMSTESVMPYNHLIPCCPLFLPPSIFPSIRVFSNESVLLIRWPKYWSFSFSISPSNEYSVLISFRMDWFDLLAVQGTLKSLLQYKSSKTSMLRCSAFFMVQLSHQYRTTGKTIVLTIWTFLSQRISLLFNMLFRFVTGFPHSSVGKESACNEGDLGLIPGLERCPGEGKGYPLQYSGLENSMDYTVHGVAKSQTRLSNFHFHF